MGLLEKLGVKLLWFDSMGAKSSSIRLDTSIGGITIDPGAAAMQPSYPLPTVEKKTLRERAIKRIESSCRASRVIIITHYHYDHHVLPDGIIDGRAMYLGGKTLILKNPNYYINESQWVRVRLFLAKLMSITGDDISNHLEEPMGSTFPDPVECLTYAMKRNFGDYTSRRLELLEKGRKWFKRLMEKLWTSKHWIKDDITLGDGTRIVWGDGKKFEIGNATIEILNPWFHGIEYDRTGWITPIIIVKNNWKIFYTSDVMGPQIEDYAYSIVDVKPDIIIADGPPTYLFPYMMNKVNLERAINNMVCIIENVQPKLIIYDHHLLRERRWREKVKLVFQTAQRYGVKLITASEYMGRPPLIDRI